MANWMNSKKNVHVALLGRATEPVLKGIQYYPVDRIHLLHSPNVDETAYEEIASKLSSDLHTIGIKDVNLHRINPFDLYDVIDCIVRISQEEKEADLFVNITGGTNLMAGAACSASFFLGAKAYYVLDENRLHPGVNLKDLIVELPIPRVAHRGELTRLQTAILKRILDSGGTTSSADIRLKLLVSPQSLSYNLKALEKQGLVKTARGLPKRGYGRETLDRRSLMVSLTHHGRLYSSWIE